MLKCKSNFYIVIQKQFQNCIESTNYEYIHVLQQSPCKKW